jgi:hypothetical protein
MRRYFALILLILMLAVLVAHAEDFWVKKDWKKWSLGECDEMLNASPWGKRLNTLEVSAGGSGSSGGAYVIRLYSALPIREAIVRRQQITQRYDKMTDAEKKEVDDRAERFLSHGFDETIVFRVDYTEVPRIAADLIQEIHEDASNCENCFLVIDHKEKVRPVRFAQVKGEKMYDVTFPRAINGRPVVAESAEVFTFQFERLTTENPSAIVGATFVQKYTMWKGKPAF